MAGSKEREQGGHRGGTTKFEDIFEVIDRDPDGKKFDRVSGSTRVEANSTPSSRSHANATPLPRRGDNDFRSRWRRR